MVMPRLSATFALPSRCLATWAISLLKKGCGAAIGPWSKHLILRGFWPLCRPLVQYRREGGKRTLSGSSEYRGWSHAGRQGVLLYRAAAAVRGGACAIGGRYPRRQDLRDLPRRRGADLGRQARHQSRQPHADRDRRLRHLPRRSERAPEELLEPDAEPLQ